MVTNLDTSDPSFSAKFSSAVASGKAIVMHSAEWCQACKAALAYILMKAESPGVTLVYINTPSDKAETAVVTQFPTFELYEGGRKTKTAVGANATVKAEVLSWVGKRAMPIDDLVKLADTFERLI